MKLDLVTSLYVFMLAAFIGFEVIRRVSPLLHTPLMSLTNALDAIAVVGAIILVGEGKSTLATILGTIRLAVHPLVQTSRRTSISVTGMHDGVACGLRQAQARPCLVLTGQQNP